MHAHVDTVVASTVRDLDEVAPELVDGFRAAVPRAADVVGRRLRGALHREGLLPHPGVRSHAFDRYEFVAAGVADPAVLLAQVPGSAGLAAEVSNAVVNLAIAYARGAALTTPATDPDGLVLAYERLATEGHNLHPCGRTRLGWSTVDILAHDLETPGTWVRFVALAGAARVGEDVGALLRERYPDLVPVAPAGFVAHPVHAWQVERLCRRYGSDLVRPLPGAIPALPTAAIRTLLLPPAADNTRMYLKLSLDVQITSTQRTVSVASTRNGPVISALLQELLAGEERVLVLPEPAGAALTVHSGQTPVRDATRDAGAIVRTGLGRVGLTPDETVVPAIALPAIDPATGRPVLAGLVDAYTRTTGAGVASFVEDYARVLLPPVLRLATRHGVGLEAHLQNCLPTFRGGAPYRMVFRDLAGLRWYPPRRVGATDLALWPGSRIVTSDVRVLLAKVVYTALQAHLGELVIVLTRTHGLDEDKAWRVIRDIVDQVYEDMGAVARVDHAFLTGPTIAHKALVRMRLSPATGDIYVPVTNPLHRS